MTISEQKSELRHAMKTRRASLSDGARRTASQEICARLANLEIGNCVAVYLAKENEASIDNFTNVLLQRKTKVAAPIYEKNAAPRFAQLESLNDLQIGALRLRMPRDSAPPILTGEIDTIFLPGLAFDNQGARLGFGSGWYDKVRPNLGPNCILIGVCWDFQLLDEIPVEEHDARVHLIVTPSQILHV